MKFYLILIVVTGLMLVSCSDSSDSDADAPFSCGIILQDANSNPLEEYKVQLSSLNYYEPEENESISRDLDDGDDIELLIMNYWDTPIDTLFSELGQSILWNGNNYLGEPVIQGVYKYRLTAYENGEVEYQQTRFMYLLYGIEEDKPGIVRTSTRGEASFSDITPLPGLYCTEEIPDTDENGEYLGPLDISPNSFIIAQNPDGEIRYTRRMMQDGKNNFTIVWEEMTPVEL